MTEAIRTPARVAGPQVFFFDRVVPIDNTLARGDEMRRRQSQELSRRRVNRNRQDSRQRAGRCPYTRPELLG
jgi:hypothetical protein